ncbi:hypothetical protein [Macrococcus brunensis]|uniref:hypothetical protein n=1 Tax=Macrococcus brunensis TaxID=198483 RepID=UPI001EF09059|nr:hypothetical protein [Macrococcus brunensis]ULG72389.1 hypothetical protein MGG12_02390 [Macrococcus brunensis]ULG74650.1 hypothetical protein MGG13_02470 [Macrococcus brunensis]
MLKLISKLFSRKKEEKQTQWPPKHAQKLTAEEIQEKIDENKSDENQIVLGGTHSV